MNSPDDKTSHELSWKESQDAFLRFNPLIVENQRLSAAYAQLAVRSALILNSGAIFVLPAYISAITSKDTSIPQATLFTAAGYFIVGIITAVACAYLAYWNHMYRVWDYEYKLNKEIQEIKEGYDTTHQIRLAKPRDKWHEQVDELVTKNERRINRTAIAGNALGITSYVVFIMGCYFGGKAMLG